MVDIRRCREEEIGQVSDFINEHWQKNHVLAVNRSLMNWQHQAEDGSYDYLVAWHNQKLVGILGYISTRRFDPALSERNVIWLALWKVLDNSGVTGLGLRMLQELGRIEPHAGIAVNGINPAHPPMYRALRYQVAEQRQFFITNPDKPSRLIWAASDSRLPTPLGAGAKLTELSVADLAGLAPDAVPSTALPCKTASYFANRFLRNPFYRYRVHLLRGSTGATALMASRIATSDNARALRIVDFAGDPSVIAEIGESVASLMQEVDAEYADFWQYGLPDKYFAQAGFAPVDPNGPVIVPNYFEPFLAKTGRILCAYKPSAGGEFAIFRADGDQDRPNRLG